MNRRRLNKVLAIMLSVLMVLTTFSVAALAEETDLTWTKVDLADITDEDTIAITMTKGETTWVLPAAATSSAPAAIVATVDGDTLTTDVADYGWTFTETTGGYHITNAGGKYLYVINNNNGVRVGDTAAVWSVDEESGYLSAADTGSNTRYLGVYLSTPDWRCYKNPATNINDQTLGFWKLEGEPVVPPEPTLGTIAEALAGAENARFMVKGVVTLVDGRNVYIQDETGGICLYFGDAPTDIALGDTVIGTGARTTYKGLPELTGAVYEKSEGLTLAAKETTIGDLGTADICTYVQIKGLTVTAVSGTTLTVQDAEAKSIQIYNAVLGETVPVAGDVIDFKGAVGIFNSTLQLRNTVASEITVRTYDKISDALAGEEGAAFTVKGVVTLVDGKNVYIQDATGGICLYFGDAPTDIALGDTVIGTGARKTHKGLPELDGAVYEKSEGLTLTAKETTIGDLATTDICTYVEIKGVEVTEVYDNNGAYSAPNITVKDGTGATIQLYKAVVGKTDGAWDVKVGDTLNIKAAVGVNNTTLQLRNTVATEIEAVEPEPEYDKISDALAGEEGAEFTVKGVVTLVDGRNVYIQDATGGICLFFGTAPTDIALGDTLVGTGTRAVYRGLPELSGATYEKSSGLTLTAKETTIGALTTADICTYVELKGVEVTEVYDNNGAYSSPNITVKDGTDATIQIYKAVVGKTDGAWDVKVGDTLNIKAAVGVNNTTLQLRNTLATEIEVNPDEAPTGIVTDLAQLTDGAKVVIFNKANKMALSQNYSGNYNAGVAVTVNEDGTVTGFGATEIWTVGVNEDGTYTFSTASGSKLSMDTGYTSMPLDKVNDTWTVTAVDGGEDTFYIGNVGRAGYVMEWYASKGTWSCYNNGTTGDLFQQCFYLAPELTPAEGKTYGLVTTLTTGDKVIIYNDAYDRGVSSTVKGTNYLDGVTLVPDAGVITTADTTVVWTVTVNEDGTYTFTQGDKTLGGVQKTNAAGDKTYTNLVSTGASETAWTRVDAGNNASYLYLDGFVSSKENGHFYLEWTDYNNYDEFTLYDYANPGTNGAFIYTFYKEGAEPEVPVVTGDLVTSLTQLVDGATVAIYSPGHHTAISTKPNGDWYLKANTATIEDGKVKNFTSDFVWKVKVNADGTYSFYSNDDATKCITVWPSGDYAEVTVNYEAYTANGDNKWELSTAKTANCYYIKSKTITHETKGDAYIEAYVRNEAEVFSGYFVKTNSYNFTDNNFALQFYLVNPDDAIPAYDDGEWDGVLQKGSAYVAYNASAESAIGLWDEANYSMKAIPTTIGTDNKAEAGNGAYVFKVDTMGRYYTFEIDGKFLATNEAEELFFAEPLEDGKAPENAKWYLTPKTGGYIIYNKDVTYNGTPVCVEYYSSVFSGWTFSTKNDVNIYLFNFYEVAEGTEIHGDVVQAPSVKYDCEDYRYFEQDYKAAFSLDDLAPEITSISIVAKHGGAELTIEDYVVSSDGKGYSFTVPAVELDGERTDASFTIEVTVTNSYGITYQGVKTVENRDEPFFDELTPAPNDQTREEKRPAIGAKIGNVGDAPTFTMTLTYAEEAHTVEATFADGRLTWTPDADLPDGRVTVKITVTRADGVSAEKAWSFTIGEAGYKLYFGQLHSHTTYSDGSGTLETALDYVAALPESANVDFVAFTDHSNYFDTTSAANPADALNDKTLMTEASLERWNTYKSTAAAFTAEHENLIALAGFEMTWSGGPGHINTFDSDGLVSRNNASLNNKSGDAGMKLYYETVNKGDSINQFNHPGTTFGNFTDFSYWDEETDAHFFLVEVGNGEGQIGAGGYYPSYEQYDLALSKGWHVAPTNNQDNHKGRWGNANDARDVVLAETFTEQGIYEAIRALRVYATEDKNLEIVYTVNDMPMGTVFGEEKPAELNLAVTLYDPDATDAIEKVEVIADGGKVVHTWSSAVELAEGALSVTLAPEETYYYIRVTERDGDKAVTAPVWVGSGVSAGISDFVSEKETAVVNEAVTLTTTVYNNEAAAATVTAVTYTLDGETVVGTDNTSRTVPANGTLDIPFAYTPTVAKRQTITVSVQMTVNGKQFTYTKDLILSVRTHEGSLDVTDISAVRAVTEEGYEFAIEGVVTSNASGYDKDTAFFDCIYVQDATGGICCFPVSGEFKIGDKVHVEGYTDFYQGEPELQVVSIEVIGEGSVEPTEVGAADINGLTHLGDLVTVKGVIDSIDVVNGLIQTIMVRDSYGGLCRVFIDGYITTGAEVENAEVGYLVTATGLSSYDDTWPDTNYFARIRIRNRADIVCTAPTWSEPVWTWTQTETGYSAEATFTCSSGTEQSEVAEVTSVDVAGSCTEDAKTVYTATVVFNETTYTDVKEVVTKAAPGHTPGEAVKEKVVPATCVVDGSYELVVSCTVCGTELSRTPATEEATGHAWGDWTPDGEAQHKRICANDPTHVETGAHTFGEGVVTVEPTATAAGEKTFTCTVCGYKKTEEIPKTEPEALLGDVNNDGKVTAADARLALRAAVGLETYEPGTRAFKAADVDLNEQITAADARLILRKAVGYDDKEFGKKG